MVVTRYLDDYDGDGEYYEEDMACGEVVDDDSCGDGGGGGCETDKDDSGAGDDAGLLKHLYVPCKAEIGHRVLDGEKMMK